MDKEDICIYAEFVKLQVNCLPERLVMPEVQDWIFLLADKFNECGFKVTIVCDCERYYISDGGLIFCPVCDRCNILKNITFRYLIVCGDHCDLTGLNADVKIMAPCDCTQKKVECINGFSGLDDCIVTYFNEYQKDFFTENSGISFVKINTGIDKSLYKDFSFYEKKNKMVWSSHKHRGLRFFIERVFPLIRQRVPDFELEVCSYIDDVGGEFDSVDGVTYLGFLTKKELAERQKESKIWVYPNTGVSDDKTFDGETFCLTAIENAAAGNAVVVADRHGFSDTLKGYSGFVGYECFADGSHVVDGEDNLSLFAEILAERAVELLTNEEYRLSLVNELQGICKDYTIENVVGNYVRYINKSFDRYIPTKNMLYNLKTRLVFHFWVPRIKTQFYYDINNIHLECLKNYNDRFNETIIVLACDDINDAYIEVLKHKIYDIDFKGSIHIKIIKNDDIYREAITFNDEIMHKLDKLDGVTFFAHNKGTSRYDKDYYNLTRHIIFMYYMNLQPFQVVKCQLSSPLAICYGTMLYFNPDDSVFLNKHQWAYLGSFQWINTKKLYEYIGKNKITYDTSDAETFIPNNVPFNRDLIRSYGLNYATDMDGLYRLKHFDEPDGFEYIMNKQVDSYILSKFYEFYYYITKKVT